MISAPTTPPTVEVRNGTIAIRPVSLPFVDDVEVSLLSGVIFDNRLIDAVAPVLSDQDFGIALHGRLWRAVIALRDQRKPVDPFTLRDFLAHDVPAELEPEGGYFKYIVAMTSSAYPLGDSNAKAYATVVLETARRRRMIEAALGVVDAALAGGPDAAKALADYANDLDRELIPDGGREDGLVHANEIAEEWLAAVEAASRHRLGEILGVPSGVTGIDKMLGGLQEGTLVVLGGRPSMGKTAAAVSLIRAASRSKKPNGDARRTALFSLEMPSVEIMSRFAAADTGISARDQRTPGVSIEHIDSLTDWRNATGATMPLWIADRPSVTAAYIRAQCRRLQRQGGLDLVVIDYLQIMSHPGKDGNRTQAIGETTMALKALSKELGCPVVLLSQLSRDLEKRDDKRPQMSDLRDSGTIEQDADVIIFLYREDYYLERHPPKKGAKERNDDFFARQRDYDDRLRATRGLVELIVAKHRQGRIGTIMGRLDLMRSIVTDTADEPPKHFNWMRD